MARAAQPVRLAITALVAIWGLALAPAPSLAQDQPAIETRPADPADYRCFVLLQDRRAQFAQRSDMNAEERAEIVNNLTIVSAFYAGRMTHYRADEAAPNIARMREALASSTAEQRDQIAAECADFYLGVMDTIAQLDQGQQ